MTVMDSHSTVDTGVRVPETRLGALNRSLLDLAGALTFVDSEQNTLLADCRAVLRQTIAADLLAERHMVAIAGTQGTGKTTLARNLYGLGREWMLAGRGQGERLPVFILEHPEVSAPEGVVTRLVDDANGKAWRSFTVDPERWRAALRDDNGETLAMELYVPPRFFPGATPGTSGLLLLPGYEPRTDDNSLWQQLMRQALVGSSRVVLVTHHQDLAAGQVDAALNDLRHEYLRGSHPLVAITHCEPLADDPDARQRLRATAATRFDVPVGNVFCTWTTATASPPLDRLAHAVADFTGSAGIERGVQIRRLETVLRTDLGRVLDRAGAALRARPGRGSVESRKTHDLLTRFDDAEAGIRVEYERQLTHRMTLIRRTALQRLEHLHAEEVEGWENWWHRRVNFLSLRAGVNRSAFERRILDAWQNGGATSPVTAVLPDVLSGVVENHFTRLVLPIKSDWVSGVHGRQSDPNGPVAVIREIRRLITLDRDVLTRPTAELDRAIAVLPALVLEWAHVGTLYPQLLGLSPDVSTDADPADLQAQLDAFVQRMNTWNATQQEMVGAWASMAGLTHGTPITTVQGLFAAARGGAGSAVARSVANVVGGGVAVAATAVITIDMINKGLRAQRSAAETAIDAIFHSELANRMEAYDDLMRLSRAILATRLRMAYHLDADASREEWLRMAVHTVDKQRLDLLEGFNGRLGALG